jgi:DNA-binding response OmpR family regulator
MIGAGARAFLRKPYSAEQILQHTRAVLDRKKGEEKRGPRERRAPRSGPTLQ